MLKNLGFDPVAIKGLEEDTIPNTWYWCSYSPSQISSFSMYNMSTNDFQIF